MLLVIFIVLFIILDQQHDDIKNPEISLQENTSWV